MAMCCYLSHVPALIELPHRPPYKLSHSNNCLANHRREPRSHYEPQMMRHAGVFSASIRVKAACAQVMGMRYDNDGT